MSFSLLILKSSVSNLLQNLYRSTFPMDSGSATRLKIRCSCTVRGKFSMFMDFLN